MPPELVPVGVEGGLKVWPYRKGDPVDFTGGTDGSGVPERESDRDKGVLPRADRSRNLAAVCDESASAWQVA